MRYARKASRQELELMSQNEYKYNTAGNDFERENVTKRDSVLKWTLIEFMCI